MTHALIKSDETTHAAKLLPHHEIVNVSPEMAKEWLKQNTCNRPLNTPTAKLYAQDMRAGRWVYNGEDLIFADDGALLNGQHRLTAIIIAETAVTMGIKRGLPRASFATMDAGRARTAGDVLSQHNFTHANATAAVARAAMLFESGRTLSDQPTRQEVTQYALENPYLQDITQQVNTHRGPLNTSPTAAVMFLANKSRRFDGDVADFLNGIHSGANLDTGDSRLTLRNWAVNERARSRGLLPNRMCFSAVARAWTAYVRGETLLQIKILRQPSRETVVIAGFNS